MRSKMATDWANLPTFILVEILSYFKLTNRLEVSRVCKKWRDTIWHLKFWKNVSLNCVIDRQFQSQLTTTGSRFSSRVSLIFNPSSCFSVKQLLDVLKVISYNRQLLYLKLEPSSFRVEWPERLHSRGVDQ